MESSTRWGKMPTIVVTNAQKNLFVYNSSMYVEFVAFAKQTKRPQNGIKKDKINGRKSSGASAAPRISAACDAPAAHPLRYGRRALGPQLLDALRAAGGRVVGELRGVQFVVEVGVGELVADGQPAGPDGRVASEQMQAPPAQAKVLDDVEDLDGLLHVAELLLLRYDEIDVDVGMDEVAVGGAAHRALDAHQAVLFGALEHGLRVEHLRVARIVDVRADPTDVLASPEAPLAQAVAAHVQAFGAAAPEEHEAAVRRHLVDLQILDLVPVPEYALRRTAARQ